MLHFNHNKYDFWEIYDSVKRFYPIGIKIEESKFYSSYSGIKDLGDIIVDNIHNEENFKSRWQDFTDEIQRDFGKQVNGTTRLGPSFSSFVLLDTNKLDNLT